MRCCAMGWLRFNHDDDLLGVWARDFLPRVPARVREEQWGPLFTVLSCNTMYKAHILPAQSLVATNSLLV